jgi:hypothetical protein
MPEGSNRYSQRYRSRYRRVRTDGKLALLTLYFPLDQAATIL